MGFLQVITICNVLFGTALMAILLKNNYSGDKVELMSDIHCQEVFKFL